MTVGLAADGTIRLDGVCPIDDAEPLLRLLSARPGASVDWRGCEGAHAAVVQVLLAARPRLLGASSNPFLQRHIRPLLAGGGTGADALPAGAFMRKSERA